MAKLTAKQRDRLPDDKFAYIAKDGERKLPVPDEGHVRSAASFFSKTDFESAEARHKAARKVLAAADEHGVELADDRTVTKAARKKPAKKNASS